WEEPVVSTAAFVFAAGVTPAGDVGFVLVGDSGSPAVEVDVAGLGEMKDVLVAVVDEALRVDGLEVAGAEGLAVAGFHTDGFDPVEGVLQDEEGGWPVGEGEDELVGKQRIGGG